MRYIRLSATIMSFLAGLALTPLLAVIPARAEPAEAPCVAMTEAPEDVPAEVSMPADERGDTTEAVIETTATTETSPALIRFNEVLPDPDGADENAEFTEIENAGGHTVDLSGWTIENGGGKTFRPTVSVAPGAKYAFSHAETKIPLVNSGMTLTLRNAEGDTVDALAYPGPAKTGRAYARAPDGSWRWSTLPTPGYDNAFENNPVPVPSQANEPASSDAVPATSVMERDVELAGVRGGYTALVTEMTASDILIVAFIPDPAGDDGAEWIALANSGAVVARLDGLMLDDADGGSKPYPLDGRSIPIGGRIEIRRTESKIALNNDADEVRLLRADGTVFQRVPYALPPEGAAREFAEGAWQWLRSGDAIVPMPTEVTIGQETALPPEPSSTPPTPDAAPSEIIVPTEVSDIDELEDDVLGEFLGVVTVPPGLIGSRTFAIQSKDGDAGVFVRAYGSTPLPALVAGDTVRIVGRPSRNGAATALSTTGQKITVIAHGDLAFQERTIDEIDDDDGGVAVTVAGTVTHRGKNSFDVTGAGMVREIKVRVGKIPMAADIVAGASVDIRGVIRYRNGTPELLLLGAGAVTVNEAPQLADTGAAETTRTSSPHDVGTADREPLVLGDAVERTVPWAAAVCAFAAALTAAAVLILRRRQATAMADLEADPVDR